MKLTSYWIKILSKIVSLNFHRHFSIFSATEPSPPLLLEPPSNFQNDLELKNAVKNDTVRVVSHAIYIFCPQHTKNKLRSLLMVIILTNKSRKKTHTHTHTENTIIQRVSKFSFHFDESPRIDTLRHVQ